MIKQTPKHWDSFKQDEDFRNKTWTKHRSVNALVALINCKSWDSC